MKTKEEEQENLEQALLKALGSGEPQKLNEQVWESLKAKGQASLNKARDTSRE